MYSRILVAIDGSDSAWQALKRAIELAKSLSAHMRVIHVVEMRQASVAPGQAVGTEAAEAILSTARGIVEAAGYEAEFDIMNSPPAQRVEVSLLEEISRWAAKLLVMGIHGRSGFKSLQPGSVAEEMTRLSPIPLLLIPATAA